MKLEGTPSPPLPNYLYYSKTITTLFLTCLFLTDLFLTRLFLAPHRTGVIHAGASCQPSWNQEMTCAKRNSPFNSSSRSTTSSWSSSFPSSSILTRSWRLLRRYEEGGERGGGGWRERERWRRERGKEESWDYPCWEIRIIFDDRSLARRWGLFRSMRGKRGEDTGSEYGVNNRLQDGMIETVTNAMTLDSIKQCMKPNATLLDYFRLLYHHINPSLSSLSLSFLIFEVSHIRCRDE